MQNNINNLSFKATITPLTKIKNKNAFVEAKKIFQEATKDFPNENMYISKNLVGETSMYLSDHANGKIFRTEEICINNIDKQIEELGINDFANKLINTFKALKLQDGMLKEISALSNEMVKLKNIMKININAAHNCSAEGKDLIAHRYQVLAENNKGKIKQLSVQQKALTDKYNRKIDEFCKQYKEFIQLKV